MRGLDVAARCALAAIAVLAGTLVAQKRAPVAANHTPIPVAASASSSSVAATGAEVEEVAMRLTEHLGEAQLDAPNLSRALTDLQLHWRRMQAPWRDTARQPNGKLVQLVALRQSATEVAHVIQTSDGGTATFDVRKWNTSEGAFAQREAIVVPAPATLKFRVKVPVAGALELAPAVLGIGAQHGDVAFVAHAGGAEIGRVVVKERDRWIEKRFDLSALGGKEIELELATESDTPGAIALWGTPRIVRRAPSRVPYNVLFIVVDSLRPDVIASFHNADVDAAKRAAKHPPGDTLLPVIEGLTPNLDALAKRSSIYRNAISGAPWTRPGTIAMLTGMHSREVGLSPLPWMLVDEQVNGYYRAEPPLLALAARRAGVATRAFVNNNFMLGYAAVGVDMGFEHVEDYRYRTADTAEVTRAALEGLRAHAKERFFHFVNYNSPHEPFEPPAECLARVPGAAPKKKPESSQGVEGEKKKGPTIDPVKSYMAEACKDDAAIGTLLAELDKLGLRDNTIVVVTADHGETLSDRHDGIALDLDGVRTRFHHAFGMWEETTRIPILLSLPGVIPEGRAIDARVTNLDLAPTLLSLLRLERDPRQAGIDLVAAARGTPVPDRAIVTFGRGSAALFHGKYRYVEREAKAQKWVVGTGDNKETLTIATELYDLAEDPGETRNLASQPAFAGLVAELHARLAAASTGTATADEAPATNEPAPTLSLRFAGGGGVHRVRATITAAGAKEIRAAALGFEKEGLRITGQTIEIATSTAANALVGVDLVISPATTPIHWTLSYDDQPLPDEAVYGGVLGVSSPGLAKGVVDAPARSRVSSAALPFIDPTIDRGVFVVRLGAVENNAPERTTSAAAAAEVKSALQQWGYAK